MWVVATAGHVDHGKSTLVRALTGMEPDRWAEERRRGMTIDLGFAWTTLPGGATVAFVDVPGHERFVPNMLAGVGPVPAVLVVVAADEGWMPQSAEHLAALDALGVSAGLLVVTRADLADPRMALTRAREELAGTSLAGVEAVAVSAVTGAGLPRLREALGRLVAGMAPPVVDAPVRLWVDRSFTVRGAGTVVTGTLAAGRLRVDDVLEVTGLGAPVRVRGLQSLGVARSEVSAVARVAVNLRGVPRERVGRGDALLSPGRFALSAVWDVRLSGVPVAQLPATAMVHVGSAQVAVRLRPLGVDTVRLRLDRPLPVLVGDRALLRDPGRRCVVAGVRVLDTDPPVLRRRGAAAARAVVLADVDGVADLVGEVRRRRLVRAGDLRRMGVSTAGAVPVAGDWLADVDYWARCRVALAVEVERYGRERPLEPGPPVEVLRRRLGLPERVLVVALVRAPLRVVDGRVVAEGAGGLPVPVARAVDRLRVEFAGCRFRAPEADRLAGWGLGPREVAAAVRAGVLLRLPGNVVLLPGVPQEAARVLAGLPQPFTVGAARRALDTTRRVAVPLLELLDATGVTRRHADDSRSVVG
ncbi:selenocysteine-specific translation elongation factor [Micromonospora yangpuensis]|uniref:Selenocysteine-specific elongation factor n=1 Tax=Micromonospora yangpuensis TaxID=683228 RepID=A0A1C6UQK0_9ACTN|nr:selenocysteine-specific translation elongation factor [Micromonospora yangpuensis]SCL56345.1 selenocysteine-specific elongation factor [Micromonospora yangpuensis]